MSKSRENLVKFYKSHCFAINYQCCVIPTSWRYYKISNKTFEKIKSICMKKFDPCKKYACKLQTCLRDNVYQPSRCGTVIEELRQCCIKHSSASLVCEGIDTTKPYEHNTIDYLETQRRI